MQLQHVRPKQLSSTGRSREQPSLVFAWERFPKLVHELKVLWPMHWREIAIDQDIVPLDPDWDCYYALDERNILAVLTVRYNGHLAGYVFNHIGPHAHYCSTIFGHTDMFWLHPRFRKGWQPVKMLLENARGLKAREVVVHTVNFKIGFQNGRLAKLFKRLGYRATDIVCRKVL